MELCVCVPTSTFVPTNHPFFFISPLSAPVSSPLCKRTQTIEGQKERGIPWEKDTPAPIYTKRFLFTIPGKSLLREWCKYRYGVFPERGSPAGDARLYPHLYPEGNRTIVSQGCGKGEEGEELPFCPLGMPYNRYGEQKQCISLL